MNKVLRVFRAIPSLLAVAGCVAFAGPAAGQAMEAVTVEAARVVTVGRTVYGAPEQQVVLRRGVSTKGLDLSTPAGKAELEKRVTETATALCTELDRMYPLTDPQKKDCVRDAVKSGMAETK
jgi:UrcA family protein